MGRLGGARRIRLPHGLHERVANLRIDLVEAARRHAEAPPARRLVEFKPARWLAEPPRHAVDRRPAHRHVVRRPRALPHGLRPLREEREDARADVRQLGVDLRARERILRRVDDVVLRLRPVSKHPRPVPLLRVVDDLVAVAERLRRGDDRGRRRAGRRLLEEVRELVPLHPHLGLVGDARVDHARHDHTRLPPVGRRLHDLREPRLHVALLLLRNLGPHGLALKRARHEADAPVAEASEAVPAVDVLLDLQRHRHFAFAPSAPQRRAYMVAPMSRAASTSSG